ncbi:MAG: hypothetical protein ACJA0Z_000249 [Halioglobus sp.]|jgi:hypothetical protein
MNQALLLIDGYSQALIVATNATDSTAFKGSVGNCIQEALAALKFAREADAASSSEKVLHQGKSTKK